MSKKCFTPILIGIIIAGVMLFECSRKGTKEEPPPTPIWTTYNTSNSGLAINYVKAIAIDSSSIKWFGTGGGVSKFDSYSWTIFDTSNSGLANNHVAAIAFDYSGDKWFGTVGVSKFHE